MDEWRQQVVDEARTWLNTPYLHRARVKGVGCDCGGLLYECYGPVFGPFPPMPDNYAPDWSLHKEGNEIYLAFIMPYVQQIAQPVFGGFSLFKYGHNFSHAAIFTGRTYVHAYGSHRQGFVREDAPRFFSIGKGAARPRGVKHFDVSESWLHS